MLPFFCQLVPFYILSYFQQTGAFKTEKKQMLMNNKLAVLPMLLTDWKQNYNDQEFLLQHAIKTQKEMHEIKTNHY